MELSRLTELAKEDSGRKFFSIAHYLAYFSDRGRLEQADRGRRNGVAAEALG
jgi:hypothetical protein